MSYVQRESGKIVGVFANRQEGFADEELPDDDAEVIAFLNPPPPPYSIYKSTPWLRMTEAEAEIMEGVMAAAGARLRQIYAAAILLNSADPLWPTLHGLLVAQFGTARADELLAAEA